MPPESDFTLDGYRALLDSFHECGYRIRGFTDVHADQPHLILRHDLDMSIQAARPIADIEAARGLHAHYFVLLRTEMYNPWSGRGRADLLALSQLGHQIGLHFDAALYPEDIASLDDACRRECDALEQLLGRPVAMVSLHRPSKTLLGVDRELGGRPHVYQPRWFENIGYCSDSRGAWGHGDPMRHRSVTAGRAFQLLTHPIWWTGDPGSPVEKLLTFVDGRVRLLRNELAAQCVIFPKAPRGW